MQPTTLHPNQPKRRKAFIPGQMLLRIREDAVRPHLGASPLRLQSADAGRLPAALAEPLQYLRDHAGLKSVRPIFSDSLGEFGRIRLSAKTKGALAMLSSVAHVASEHLAGINVVHFDPTYPVEPLVKALKAAYAFDICEPMPARWHMGLPLRLEPARPEPTGPDPLANRQWGLRAIRWFDSPMPEASKVTVAVLDTGIDVTHPDLAINDVDYHHTGLSPIDIIGHGTHVSGIIAARSRNAIGIAGIADCKLAVWKVFTDEPDSDGEFYVEGERYLLALRDATSSGARVMNLSIGGTASSRTENLLFQKAIAGGCTVVAAMGNEFEEGNPTEYPGAYQDVLAVGAVDESLRRAPFSNTGMHIGLVAPGANILSTLPMQPNPHREETAYAAWSGTSMATPHVAAAAALVAAKYPKKTAIQVRDQLLRNTTRLPGMGVHKKTAAYGSGLLNLRGALLAA